MPVSPSSSVQRAREQLAERLRDIRLDASLTARALSAAAGWHEAKTSRIESAKKAPSEDDIRTWCRVCGAERAIPDLIAASRSADSMYTEWRRLQPAGMRRDQENRLPLHERTKVLKAYVGTVVPGFLQTPEYATALLSAIRDFHGTPDDVADAVAARMQRKRLVQSDRTSRLQPGRMLPMLLGKFHDDVAESLGMELPPLPRRSGPVKAVKLDDLTSSELGTLSGAVLVLVTRFTALMDDPLLPKLLREFRDALATEKTDRARIADELTGKARAS